MWRCDRPSEPVETDGIDPNQDRLCRRIMGIDVNMGVNEGVFGYHLERTW